MGKPKNKFNYSKNRRRAWKKKKKLPAIGCEEVRQAWDDRKSLQANLKEMGLSVDPNKSLRIPSTKETMGLPANKVLPEPMTKNLIKKPDVIEQLEEVANAEQPIRMRLADPEVKYCIYMMERYGEDYKAMARDDRNYYQDTPKQIRRKINSFKSLPEQYNEYLSIKNSAASRPE